MIDVDAILQAMSARRVDCILIGGMNFLLNHQPVLTYDMDLWVARQPANVTALNLALTDLGAEWGANDDDWGPTPADPAWLSRQMIYCLTTRCGALDIFFEVKGLEGRYAECRLAAHARRTVRGTPYFSLSDEHMLACQEALDEGSRRLDRMTILRAALAAKRASPEDRP